MMTAPSTMMPKSSAPRLMRLPLIFAVTMPLIVKSMESGMIERGQEGGADVPEQEQKN